MRNALVALVLLSCQKTTPIQKPEPPKPIPVTQTDFARRGEEISAALQSANAAYKEKNYEGFATQMELAVSLSPYNPDLKYRLARAYWLSQKKEEALKVLQALAQMELVYPLDHPDLAGLQDDPSFARLSAAFSPKEKHPSQVLAAPGAPDLLIEGIAFDAKTRRFYISSVHQRTIYELGEGGALTPFIERPEGMYGAFGMAIDAEKRLLWVASSAVPEAGSTKEEQGRAGVFCFELESKKLVASYLAPADKERVFGDVALGANGEVFVSDSAGGEVFVLRGGKLEVLVASGYLRSPQGMAPDKAGKGLFVVDYASGLYWVERESGEVYQVETPSNVSRYGTDGIYWQGGALWMIQNGTRPARVVKLTLKGKQPTSAEVIERGHSEMIDPTLGTLAEEKFCYVANSQWGNFEGANLAKETTPARVWCYQR